MKCAECPKEIHPERLAARPNTITCSAECTKNRQARHRSESSTRAHKKRRAEVRGKGKD